MCKTVGEGKRGTESLETFIHKPQRTLHFSLSANHFVFSAFNIHQLLLSVSPFPVHVTIHFFSYSNSLVFHNKDCFSFKRCNFFESLIPFYQSFVSFSFRKFFNEHTYKFCVYTIFDYLSDSLEHGSCLFSEESKKKRIFLLKDLSWSLGSV